MAHPTQPEPICQEVRRQLSSFLDGETSRVERLGIEEHLSRCAPCSRELTLQTELRSLLRGQGRDVPSAPPWAEVRQTVERLSQASIRSQSRLPWVLAASLAMAALVSLLLVLPGSTPDAREATGRGQQTVETPLLMAGLPGLESYLALHSAKEVVPDELGRYLEFRPSVPTELAGRYRLEKAYVVQGRRSTGSCLIYRHDDQLVTIVQQAPSQPVRWGNCELQETTIAGLSCRRGSSRGVEVLQIDPRGLNLTLVARQGSVDLDRLVEELSSD